MKPADREEVANALLQTIGGGGEFSFLELCDEVPFGEKDVLSTLGLLRTIGVVEKRGEGGAAVFKRTEKITAFHLAKLANIGADFVHLPKWWGLSSKQMEAGLALASEVSRLTKMMEDEAEGRRKNHRKPEECVSDEVTDTLELLVQASKSAISAAKKKKTPKSTLALLVSSLEEAEKSLEKYRATLSSHKKGWQAYDLE